MNFLTLAVDISNTALIINKVNFLMGMPYITLIKKLLTSFITFNKLLEKIIVKTMECYINKRDF